MNYEISNFEIDPESSEGRVVADIMRRNDVTPEEAVRQILREHGERPPRHRKGPRPPLRTDDPEGVIGMFAHLEGFEEAMREVIGSREERYSRTV